MTSKVYSISNLWLESFIIEIESDTNRAMPTIDIVWLADTTIKEAKERIRFTFKNSNIKLPARKFVVNLSPSDIKKTWNRFDLPIAVSIIALIEDIAINKEIFKNSIFIWELWLDGSIKKVSWVLSTILKWKEKWFKKFFVPSANALEASYVDNVDIIWLDSFSQLLDYLLKNKELKTYKKQNINKKENIEPEVDFANIKWNEVVKRALVIAAAWLHNVLMIWWPGSGKTMFAKALQWILPPMWREETLEVSQIYSVNWMLDDDIPLISKRPFRNIHHTASQISIVWWWRDLKPGQISLAHKWILFFDELPEFPRSVLEVLRQPLEDRNITISRVSGTVNYPAHFMFVSAMNPCKCWYYKDNKKNCSCSINEIKRYQWKISGPLLDRFDIMIEVPRIDIDKLLDKKEWENTSTLRDKVIQAWKIQEKRFEKDNISSNSQMNSKQIQIYCKLTTEAENFLKMAANKLSLSARSVHRIIKFSRTVADLNKHKEIEKTDIAESLQYRSKNMFIEN